MVTGTRTKEPARPPHPSQKNPPQSLTKSTPVCSSRRIQVTDCHHFVTTFAHKPHLRCRSSQTVHFLCQKDVQSVTIFVLRGFWRNNRGILGEWVPISVSISKIDMAFRMGCHEQMSKIRFTFVLSFSLNCNSTQRKRKFPYSTLIKMMMRFLPLLIISAYVRRVSVTGKGFDVLPG